MSQNTTHCREISVLFKYLLIMATFLCCVKETTAELEGVVESSATCPCFTIPKAKAFACVQKAVDSVPSCVSSDAESPIVFTDISFKTYKNIFVVFDTIMATFLCCVKETTAELEGVVESSATCPCFTIPKAKAFACVQKAVDSVPSCVSSDAESLAIRVRGPSNSHLLSRFKQLDRLALSDLSSRELPADFFTSNTKLTAVIIRECPHLERASREIFWPLRNLTEVSIFDSGLREILNGTFRYSKALKDLSLYNNSLTTLDSSLLETTSLETISLKHNPWHCDCSMVRFQKMLELKGVSTENTTTCHTPEALRGVPLKDISQKLKCDQQ